MLLWKSYDEHLIKSSNSEYSNHIINRDFRKSHRSIMHSNIPTFNYCFQITTRSRVQEELATP